MDLHFVTLVLGEANFSCFNRGVISSGAPANVRLGNYSDDAGPARLSDIADDRRYGPSGAVMPVRLGAIEYDREAGRAR
jgi:hypothetical protein